MKKKLLSICAWFILAGIVWAQAPNFNYPFLITNSEGPIVSGNVYDFPAFGDWDSDGSLDLMVGVFYNGNIWYYHNTAPTGSPPVFDPHTVVMADGVPISVTYG